MINKFNKIFFAAVVALLVMVNIPCIAMEPREKADPGENAHKMRRNFSRIFIDEGECVTMKLYFAMVSASGGMRGMSEPDFSGLANISNEYFMSKRLGEKNVSTGWVDLYRPNPAHLAYLIVREHRPIHVLQIREDFSEMIKYLIPVLSGSSSRNLLYFGRPMNLFWSWLIISSVEDGFKCLTFDEFNDNIAKINQVFSLYIKDKTYLKTICSLLKLPREERLDRLNSKVHGIMSFSRGLNDLGMVNLFDVMCVLDADSYKLLSSMEEIEKNIKKHYELFCKIIMFAKKASEHVALNEKAK